MSIVDFDYAILRYLPSVRRQEFRNIGVILHAPAASFLAATFDHEVLAWCRGVDVDRMRRYMGALDAIVTGDQTGGPIAALPRSERFHWLTAPRSDSLQASPRHPGRAERSELAATLADIYETEVSQGGAHG